MAEPNTLGTTRLESLGIPHTTKCALLSPCLRRRNTLLSRNHVVEWRVELATVPLRRATSTAATGARHSVERLSATNLGGKLPPRTAKLAVPPGPDRIVPAKKRPHTPTVFVLDFELIFS